jgi:asparagine synthase (glutamine-hydrolysing)
LLDGQGMDEQWCGYDYYERLLQNGSAGLVQGTSDRPVRPECLVPEFAELAEPWKCPEPFPDKVRNTQYRDVAHTKIPRALRFNDRISMLSSTELREPFLDHTLVEFAFRQPVRRKMEAGVRKVFLREIAASLVPAGVGGAPKRPLQTPQREWLRGPLRGWAEDLIENALVGEAAAWFRPRMIHQEWQRYLRGESDNSHYVWQWLSCGLMAATRPQVSQW